MVLEPGHTDFSLPSLVWHLPPAGNKFGLYSEILKRGLSLINCAFMNNILREFQAMFGFLTAAAMENGVWLSCSLQQKILTDHNSFNLWQSLPFFFFFLQDDSPNIFILLAFQLICQFTKKHQILFDMRLAPFWEVATHRFGMSSRVKRCLIRELRQIEEKGEQP